MTIDEATRGIVSREATKILVSSLDNSPVHPPQLWSSVFAASASAFFSDHRNVVLSLPKSIRGSGCEMRNGVLVARSHFHGQEEEEGCQEGRQEEDDQEEGPWLSLPCRAAREGESGTDARAPGFHSWHPGGPVKRPDPSPWPPVCRVLSRTRIRRSRGVHAQTRKAGPGPWAPGPA